MLYNLLFYYLLVINILALILCVYDKYAAKRRLWRISENALITVSILGGSITMLLTMYIIRHKTRHKKFMLGIPVIIILQALCILFLRFSIDKLM